MNTVHVGTVHNLLAGVTNDTILVGCDTVQRVFNVGLHFRGVPRGQATEISKTQFQVSREAV